MVMISLKAKKLPHLIVVGIIVIVQCKSLHVKQANKEYSIIFTEKILRRNIKDKLFTIAENIRFYLSGHYCLQIIFLRHLLGMLSSLGNTLNYNDPLSLDFSYIPIEGNTVITIYKKCPQRII